MIKMNLKKIKWECVACIYIALDMDRGWALVNTVMNLTVP
jgi:hypothetical protein